MAIVVALDLASTFGAAAGAPGTPPAARSGRFAPQGARHGVIAGEAIRWLSRYFAEVQPGVIFVERPHLASVRRGGTSFDVLYRLLGLAFAAAGVASLRGVRDVRLVRVEDIRKHFLGSGHIPGERAKRLVQERCRELGWTFANADEADALALWSYGCETVAPGTGAGIAPGFVFADQEAAAPMTQRRRLTDKQARDLLGKRRLL